MPDGRLVIGSDSPKEATEDTAERWMSRDARGSLHDDTDHGEGPMVA